MTLPHRRTSSFVIAAAVVLVAAACQWPSVRGGPTNDAFASDETTLSLDDAGVVSEQFTADLGVADPAWQTPTVSGSQIFAPSADGLAVFDLNGVAACGGTPTACQPVWRGDVGARHVATAATATGTTVYVTAGGSGSVTLFAFDVRGEAGCSGTPKRCAPLWTATGVSWAPPVVVGSTVYASTEEGYVRAFDARGMTGCSGAPKVCTPLWSTSGYGGGDASPVAVAGGFVFQASFSGELWVYDAAGVDGCGGTPTVCRPLWRGMTHGKPSAWPTAPVVSDGRVYVSMDELDDAWERTGRTTVTGFPLDGGTGCDDEGWSIVCPPTWSAVVDGSTDSDEMAAAYGSIFVQTVVGPSPSFPSQLAAIDLDDPACSPGPCDATWTAPLASAAGLASPLIANGVVYADRAGSAAALDAHGSIGCSGTPTVCTPTTFVSFPDLRSSGWSVSNGKLFTITSNGAWRQTLRVIG